MGTCRQPCTLYVAGPAQLPAEEAWRTNTRVNCLSVAINGLRNLGYEIGLPASGGVDVPDRELKRIAADIERHSASLGSSLALSAAVSLKKTHCAVIGAFRLDGKARRFKSMRNPTCHMLILEVDWVSVSYGDYSLINAATAGIAAYGSDVSLSLAVAR